MWSAVIEHASDHRFELKAGDHVALTYYAAALSDHGIGAKLPRGALEHARSRGLKVVPKGPFTAAFTAKNAEFSDLLV